MVGIVQLGAMPRKMAKTDVSCAWLLRARPRKWSPPQIRPRLSGCKSAHPRVLGRPHTTWVCGLPAPLGCLIFARSDETVLTVETTKIGWL